LPALAALLRTFAAAAFALWLPGAFAQAPDAALVIHLLDYVAVDYPEAVRDGAIRNPAEYREMTEFAANIAHGIGRMPAHERKADLVAEAQRLQYLVASKANAGEIAGTAARLRRALVDAYRVVQGPKRAPDLERARAVFAQHCAGCHGQSGRGDGPLARGLDPRPTDFADLERQRKRSVHGLYNTISLGVEGTAMRAFPELSEADRWALAYLAAGWGQADGSVARGEEAWSRGDLRAVFPSQAAVAGTTMQDIQAAQGREAADVLAYLRRHPAAIEAGKPDPIAFAREGIARSAALAAEGRPDEALQAALSAYLDGFELVEAPLGAIDPARMQAIEARMIDYRNAIKSRAPAAQVSSMAHDLDTALEDASNALSGTRLSAVAAAGAAFLILLREGLEAVLVVAALYAFLRRADATASLRYLHAGWISALVAGLATWAAAAWVIDVSGASREVTEGVAALVASAMLLYVGFWLHQKSHARAWNAFVMRGTQAVGRGAAWGLALTAFLAVYREAFETVLFYEALWSQAPGSGGALIAGFALAAAALAVIAWTLLRGSIRLPLGLFFGASGGLLAALAVVLAGNGVAALQEAGVLPASPVAFVRISWLGIYPNLEALATQAAVASLVVALLWISKRRIGGQRLEGRPGT
jgi:high-affinity iron transporter